MKKLVSLMLVLVMVLSIFAVVPFSASAADTKTVYFQNNWMWTDVKVYFWGSSSSNSAEWPGDAVQVVGNDGTYDVYAATVPTDVAGVIFNGYDSGKGGNNQTPDITDAANGDCYYMIWNDAEAKNGVGKDTIANILPDYNPVDPDPNPNPNPDPTPSGSKTVYFQNNWMWTEVKAYFWGSSSSNSAEWPGDTVSVVGNDGVYDVYSVTVPNDVAGVIFNGFDGGIGSLNQTPDITDSADGDCYSMVWNEAEAKNGVKKDNIYTILPDLNPNQPTQAPVTQAPVTQAPVTQAPVTQAPVTQAPVTQAPATEAPVDGLFVKVGGELYEVKKGDTFTYNYYLSVDSALKISSLDINMFYDTEGLDHVPFTDQYGDVDLEKHFPKISGGVVNNFAIDGEIYYNYSNVAGTRLADDSLVFTTQFKVTADKGIYEITEKIITMADSDMNKIVYDQETIQNVFTDKVEVADASPVVPTEATEAPATQAPATQAPVTQAPATTPVVDNGLYVVADGVRYAVNKGDVITYNYYLSVDSSLKISSLDINMFYDTEGLDFVPFTDQYGDADLEKHFPKISGGVVNNFSIDGEIYYNYSNVAGTRLADKSVVFTGQFKVTADKGTYNINSKLITLADSNMNKIVYDQEVIQPDVYTYETGIEGADPYVPTTEPTQAPATQAPVTQVPATTPAVDDNNAVFVKMDGELYKVNKGDVITYQYILNVPDGTKISSIDMNTFYNTAGLDFVPYTDQYGDEDVEKHFPRISGGCVFNFGIDGEIYYNYSNVAGIRLTNDPVMFEGQFKVTADKGTYEIYTNLVTLADSDMNKIVYSGEVVEANKHTEKQVLVGLTPYVPSVTPTVPGTDPVDPTEPDGLFVRVNNTYYVVEQGKEYTFTYYLQVEDKRIGSLDARIEYDTEGLDFIPTLDEDDDYDTIAMFPIIKSPVLNDTIDGKIFFNYSHATGVKFPNKDSVLFQGTFKVTAADGIYDITPSIFCLADENLGIIVDEGIVCGDYYDKGVLNAEIYVPGDEEDLVIGDVNRDGKINVFDVTAIQRYAASIITLDEEQLKIADTNFDGTVNIFDASEIQRYISGYITEFKKK